MSHTGIIHRPNQSPGLIRIITVGYAISKVDDISKRFKKNDMIIATPLNSVEEIFVVYLPPDKREFQYGDAVKFNLLHFKDWKGKIAEDDLSKLKLSIPTQWQKWYKNGEFDKIAFENFEFKYIATEIECLPEDFLLQPLYKFIEDLDEDSREEVLKSLEGISTYNFKRILQVNCKEGHHSISGIKLIESQDFNRIVDINATNNKNREEKVKECFFEHVYQDENGVQAEIGDIGQHKMSSVEEIPTRKFYPKTSSHTNR